MLATMHPAPLAEWSLESPEVRGTAESSSSTEIVVKARKGKEIQQQMTWHYLEWLPLTTTTPGVSG